MVQPMTITQILPDDFPAQDNLFQTSFWGMFKTACGQQAAFFLCEEDVCGDTLPRRFPLMVLLRSSVSGCVYAYAPKAPDISVKEESYGIFLEELATSLHPFLPDKTVCIRFDTNWASPYGSASEGSGTMPRTELREMRMNFGTHDRCLRKAPLDHFCPDSVVIDLKAEPERILARMRQTTRNCIRRSYRMDVIFSEKTPDFLPEWHALYRDTGMRKHFYTEDLPYFQKLLNRPEGIGCMFFEPAVSPHKGSGKDPPETNGQSKILSANPLRMPISAPAPLPSFHIMAAEKDSVLLSGLILAFCGKTAYYMYSGSRSDYKDCMASYGLQWEAILAARRAGCTRYDLLGIPPDNNPLHSMSGLYTFKTGLGGATVRTCGCWDYAYNMEDYAWMRSAEVMQPPSSY